jgi:type VI secretion system secreted protein VgrG
MSLTAAPATTASSLLPVKLVYEVNIDGTVISPVNSIFITQHHGTHNSVEFSFPHEIVQQEGSFVLDDAQKLLGRLVEITIKNSNDKGSIALENKFITTNVELDQEGLNEGMLKITALSPTWLLDDAPHFESFYQSNLNDIATAISKPLNSVRTNIKANASFKETLPYVCRYNESGWNFLKRLSAETGQWLYFDGKDLIFGEAEKGNAQKLVYGQNCHNLQMNVKAQPTQSGVFGYDASQNNPLNQEANNYTGNAGSYAEEAFKRSNQLFSVAPTYTVHNSLSGSASIETIGKTRSASIAAGMYSVSGQSSLFTLKVGVLVDISFKRLGKSGSHRQMRIISVQHHLQAGGQYTNTFKAIPSSAEAAPTIAYSKPITHPMLAKVLSNEDSQGRVQVQFMGWQQDNGSQQTDWIRVASSNAGNSNAVNTNRGFMFIPEVGDQVLVDFENGNPDKPFVAHSMYHGQNGAGGGSGNHIKSIVTKSGCMIQFDDTDSQGSVTVTDPSGNTFYLDGQGNVNVTAPKNIILSAGENIMLNAGMSVMTSAGADIMDQAGAMIANSAGSDIIHTAAGMMTHSATKDFSLQAANITKIATGNISTQSDTIDKQAKKDVTISSIQGNVTKHAKKELQNNSGENTKHN